MVAKTSIYYDIVTEYQNKGAKQAQSSFNSLEKSALKLGKAFGVAFGAKEVVSFLGKSISLAAKEDQQFTSMFLATGTAKSELIPAYQSLLTATGDVALSQKDLQLAMDVSKGTGKDLATVTTALSKGYLGNTTSLTKLGAGLDKTLLKTGRMDLITKQLSNTFKGSAATAANTFEGKLTRIKAAGEEAMVILGKGLISSLQTLAGDTSLNSVTSYMTNLATETSYAVQGIADLISIIKSIPGVGSLANTLTKDPLLAIPVVGSWLSYFASKAKKKAQSQADQISPEVTNAIDLGNAQAQKAVLLKKQQQLALEKSILATQKSQTLEQKNQALLKILGTVSQDFDRANIMAALAHAQTQEIKDQLQYQLDLLDATNQTGAAQAKTIDNAIILKEKMLLAQGQVMLVDGSIVNLADAKNPFAGFDKYVQDALAAILLLNQAIVNMPSVMPGGFGTYGGTGILPGYGVTYGPGIGATGDTTTSSSSSGPLGQYGVDYGPGIGATNNQTVSLNISLDPGLIINTTNAATAAGTQLSINRNQNVFV